MHCFVGNLFRCKSAKNYKILLRFLKAISINHQANGNVKFLGHPVAVGHILSKLLHRLVTARYSWRPPFQRADIPVFLLRSLLGIIELRFDVKVRVRVKVSRVSGKISASFRFSE